MTERASTIFRGGSVSGSPGQRSQQHGFVTSSVGSSNVGLAGISKLDDSGESTRIRIRASNVIIIILHRDPLDVDNTADGGNLSEMATTFFNHVNQYSIQSLFGLNGEEVRESLINICNCDHLRYVCL